MLWLMRAPVILFVALVIGCGRAPNVIVGKWHLVQPPAEGTTDLILNKDGTAVRVDRPNAANKQAGELQGKYTAKGSDVTVTLEGPQVLKGSLQGESLVLDGPTGRLVFKK